MVVMNMQGGVLTPDNAGMWSALQQRLRALNHS